MAHKLQCPERLLFNDGDPESEKTAAGLGSVIGLSVVRLGDGLDYEQSDAIAVRVFSAGIFSSVKLGKQIFPLRLGYAYATIYNFKVYALSLDLQADLNFCFLWAIFDGIFYVVGYCFINFGPVYKGFGFFFGRLKGDLYVLLFYQYAQLFKGPFN